MNKANFAVVIPMYNEEAVARRCLEEFSAALADFSGRARLIVVDDGSSDRTRERLAEAGKSRANVAVLRHETNKGYGQALYTGIRQAVKMGFDYIIFADADMTNDPKYIKDFADKICEGYDVVKATRYRRDLGSNIEGVPLYKRVISTIGNGLASFLYNVPLTDCTNGFRAVRTKCLEGRVFTEKGFLIIMEEIYLLKKANARFGEIPYTLRSRSGDQRKSSHAYGPKMCWQYLKYPVKSFLNK